MRAKLASLAMILASGLALGLLRLAMTGVEAPTPKVELAAHGGPAGLSGKPACTRSPDDCLQTHRC